MVKWNRETIKKAAKKFKFRKEWREKDKKSYAGAQKKGLLHDKEIAGHLITIKGALPSKWLKEKVLKSAKKFKYKRDWNLRESGAYQAALRNRYMAEATKHMKTLGHIYKRCLYSIEVKNEKIIYIGLTFNFERRIKAHLKTNRFKKLIKEFGRKSLIIKKLTNYIDRDKVSNLEINLIKKLKKKKYFLLNIHKGGGVGRGYKIWTKNRVLKSAKKFKHRARWHEKYPGAYNAAMKDGYYTETTKHMDFLNPVGKWTKKAVLKDALKYNFKGEWWKNSGAYKAAIKKGWFKEATAHMPDKFKFWTKEKVLKDALKYKTKKEWENKSRGAVVAARREGYYKKATAHMKSGIKIFWTKEKILKDALKYKTKITWCNAHNRGGAYDAALKYGFMKEAARHMKSGRTFWTKEKVLKDALKYKTKEEWKSKSGAYYASLKKKWYKKATAHM